MTMKSLIIKIAHEVISLFKPDSVRYKNMILPAKHLRFGGTKFQDDRYFFASAQAEADRLVEYFGLTADSRVLDVGCGVGRLPIGILSRIGEIQHYRGVDVSKRSIRWCQRHITGRHPSFQFIHIDVKNPRYNPSGRVIDIGFRLPFDNEEFDIIYLYSVFTHMTSEDVRIYLKEFQRLLSPSGKIFLTAFIEDGVPDMTINPRDYKRKWTGPLHCVRYNKDFFESLLAESGFGVEHYGPAGALYISRRKKDTT